MLTEEEKKNLDKYQGGEENPETYFRGLDDFWSSDNPYWMERHSFATPYVGDDAYGWKFHIHADNDKDWQKVASVIIPYLRDHDITFKTFNMLNVQENGFYDKSNNQYGKAFTIYPNNDEEFAKIANDLNYILENNNLNQQGAIHGDHQIGDHGRIFYRNTWTSKDNPHYYANAYAENPVYKADDIEDPFLNVLGYPNDNSRAEAMMAGYEKKKVVNRLENLSKAENDIQQRLQKEENSSILEYDMVVVSDQNQIFGLHSKPNNIKALGKGEYSSVLQSAQKAQQEVFSALGNWLHDEFYDQHSSIGNREKGALFFSRNYEQRMHQEFDEHENLHRIEIHDLERYDGDEYEGAYIYKEHPRARFFVNDKDNLYLQSWSDRNHAYTFNNGELTVTSLNGKDDYESLKFKDGIISEKIALLNGQRIKYQYDTEGHLLGTTSPEKDILDRTPIANLKQPKKIKTPPKAPVKGLKANPLKGKDIAAKLKEQKKSTQKAAKPQAKIPAEPLDIMPDIYQTAATPAETRQPETQSAAAANMRNPFTVNLRDQLPDGMWEKLMLPKAIQFAHSKDLKDKATLLEIIKYNRILRQVGVPADQRRNVKKEIDMMNALAQRRMEGFLSDLGKMEKAHKNPPRGYVERINLFLKEFDYPGASGYIPTVRKVRNRLRDFKYSPEKAAVTDKPAAGKPQVNFVPKKESFWSKAKKWIANKAQSIAKGMKTAGLAFIAGMGASVYGVVKLAKMTGKGVVALKNKIVNMVKAVKQSVTDKLRAGNPAPKAKPNMSKRPNLWQKAKSGLNKFWQTTKNYVVGAAIFVSGFLLGKQCSDNKNTEENKIPLQEQSITSEISKADDGKTIQMPLQAIQKKEVRHAESDAKAYYDSAIKLHIGEQKQEALYSILEKRAEKGELNLGHFPVERYAHSMVMYQKIQPGNEINKLFNKVVGGKQISAVDNIKMNKAVHRAGTFGDGIKGIGKDSAFDRNTEQDKQQHIEVRKEYRKSIKGKANMINKARNNLQASR